jgi:hypothetical protein
MERIERSAAMKTHAVLTICVAVVTLSIFATAAQTGAYKYEETYTRTIELENEVRLVIGNKRGDIIVIGEEGRTELELIVTEYVRAESEKIARQIAEEMSVSISRKDGDCIIIAIFPDTDGDKKSIVSVLLQRDPKSHMDIKVMAPPHLALKLKASSGDVTAENISNTVHASTASGDIVLKRIEGDSEVSASSGNIVIEEHKGDVKIDSASGDVTASEIEGDVHVKTASGDIELEELTGNLNIISASGETLVNGAGNIEYKGSSGDAKFYGVRGCVEASAASGDLSLQVAPEGGHDYVLRASSGHIELRFLKRMPGGFVLKANTTNGDIEVNLPIQISKVGRHLITGIVREGKNVVKLETVSGSITIIENEE